MKTQAKIKWYVITQYYKSSIAQQRDIIIIFQNKVVLRQTSQQSRLQEEHRHRLPVRIHQHQIQHQQLWSNPYCHSQGLHRQNINYSSLREMQFFGGLSDFCLYYILFLCITLIYFTYYTKKCCVFNCRLSLTLMHYATLEYHNKTQK